MYSFFEKFFEYFNYTGRPEPYKDGLGAGAFLDWRHYLWMILVVAICVGCYQLFKRKPKAGKTFILVLMIYLFTVRLTNQIYRAAIGAEFPVWEAFPFHMCTVMTFLMPMVVVFGWKKLKTPVYILSMMGGIVTILMGDYFDNRFLASAAIEGMLAHTILILVPIIDIAIGEFRIEFKKIWTVFLGLSILLNWATLANDVFFKNYDPNYMYIRHNGLPGNFGGDFYFLIYLAIFTLLVTAIFGIPTLYRHLLAKADQTNKQ